MRKVWNLIFSMVVFLPLLTSLFGGITANAADIPDNVDVTIHKRIYKEGDTKPEGKDAQNTGNLMEFGGKPFEGVEFTVYDISKEYYDLMKVENANQEDVSKELSNKYVTPDAGATNKITSIITDAEGLAVFSKLPTKSAELSDDKQKIDAVYVFVETKTPDSITISKKSAPIVLSMPVFAFENDTYDTENPLENVHLYPKNETTTDKKTVSNLDQFDKVEVGGKTFWNLVTGSVIEFDLDLALPADMTKTESYSVLDTPSEGLEFIETPFVVSGINNEGESKDLIAGTDYNVKKEGNGFQFDLIMTSDTVKSLNGGKLKISYSMKLTAEVRPDELQNNSATVSVDNKPQPSITPKDPEVPVVFGTGGKKFIKTDSHNGDGLEGAEFIVKKGNEFAEFEVNKKGEYAFVKWTNEKNEATKIVSAAKNNKYDLTVGSFSVIGLKQGGYQLEEVKAPSDKYVKLTKDVTFDVVQGSYEGTKNLGEVKNTPKGILPSTGGNGIYAFLAIGSLMMASAYFWFKKANNTKRA
ncbi:MAG TPA: isopeptide-forming domain-containing fimbrial protein [Vagococcus sp.]|nr:isopeptide-forming domain-containing fimbrial protein [Vagococcus sp.]